MALTPGTRLGPYEIVAPLGAGGMGEVYRAKDPRLAREVAVKVLPAAVAADAERRARFQLEARAIAAISHDNILTIHDLGVEGETLYVVFELIDGATLRKLLAHGALSAPRAAAIAVGIARGLAAAHDKGIVHRDLKPENVIVTRDGRVRILDFGLARWMPAATSGSQSMAPTAVVATEAGVVLGTVGYMAPEQVRGLAADPGADHFALGVMLFEMLAGSRPFGGETPADTMSAILREEPPDLARLATGVPAGLARIVRRCLEKEPDARFRSAHDLAFSLDAFAQPGPSEFAKPGVPGVSTRAGSPTFERLTFRNGFVSGARFTPDRHGVVYGASWEGGPIELFTSRLGSPESRSLGLPPANLLAISRTGEMALSRGFHHTFWYQVSGTLARASLSGGGVRMLLEDTGHADWAPDGESMAVVHFVGRRCRLEYPVGRVLHETSEWLSRPSVSRDGKRVAFIEHSTRGHTDGDVCVADESGRVRVLAASMITASGLAWSPSGDEVWFSGIDEQCKPGVWSVDLDGHRRTLFTHSHRVWLQDVAEDGRALLAIGSLRAEMNLGGGPDFREIGLSWFDGSYVTDISADGEQILFFEGGEAENPHYGTYLRGVDGSPAVRLGRGVSTRFSPDGAWVLVTPFRPEPDLLIYPTGIGEPVSLRSPQIERYHWAGWHPDGQQVFLIGSTREKARHLYRGPRSGGKWSRIWDQEVTMEWIDGPPIAPDGNRLVVRGPDHVVMMLDVTKGEATPLDGFAREDEPLRFDGAGRALFIANMKGRHPRIDRLDLQTSERKPWREIRPTDPTGVIFASPPVITPDGERHAYTLSRQLTDLYLVEGLDA